MWKYICRIASKVFLHENWMIGWIDQPIENSINWRTCPPIQWIGERSSKRYLADPFPWPGQNNFILCENYDFRTRIGTLLQLDIKGDTIANEQPIALPMPGHLSFPFMFQSENEFYLIPESSEARRTTIFKWHTEEKAWREFVTPLPDTAAADSIFFEHDGYFWIAYTDIDLNAYDNLNLCYASSLAGPWLKHPGNPVKRDIRTARCGGTPFRVGTRLYRPAQDCSERYGGAIRIMETIECTPLSFCESEIAFLAPNSSINPHGLHTLSAWADKCLVDGKRMMFSPDIFLNRLWRFAKKPFHFL